MIRARFVAAALTLVLLGSVLTGSIALGQAAPGEKALISAIPLALDLKKVPVGTWAEYRMGDGRGGTLSLKMVLVGQRGKVSDVETIITGGPLAAIGQTAMRASIYSDTGVDLNPKEHIVQMGDNAPMLIPGDIGGAQSQGFRKPDPENKVGVESVTVAAATFPKAEHYREKLAGGDVVDSWLSKDVPPFGLVKLNAGVDPQGAPIVMELVSRGRGAKAVVTRKPLPFDRLALVKQLQPMLEAAQKAGAASGNGATKGGSTGSPAKETTSK